MAVDLFTDKVIIMIVKRTASLCSIAPILIGYGYGLMAGNIGMCKSAEFNTAIINIIVPIGFLAAPAIFGLIFFFIILNKPEDTISGAVSCLLGALTTGIGGGFGAYTVGVLTATGAVTKAQQKKFSTSFMVILVFAELLALFGLLGGFLLANKS